mmetsp:Transcript_4401/g.8551  ORF Transcript_4401/g.8551 Transcript_4401/m.8551 type:complete len:227 (-) Transcript_4401:365-1045(-)
MKKVKHLFSLWPLGGTVCSSLQLVQHVPQGLVLSLPPFLRPLPLLRPISDILRRGGRAHKGRHWHDRFAESRRVGRVGGVFLRRSGIRRRVGALFRRHGDLSMRRRRVPLPPLLFVGAAKENNLGPVLAFCRQHPFVVQGVRRFEPSAEAGDLASVLQRGRVAGVLLHRANRLPQGVAFRLALFPTFPQRVPLGADGRQLFRQRARRSFRRFQRGAPVPFPHQLSP